MSVPNVDHHDTRKPVCPHCGETWRRKWSLKYSGNTPGRVIKIECGSCKREYAAAKTVTVRYTTMKLKGQE